MFRSSRQPAGSLTDPAERSAGGLGSADPAGVAREASFLDPLAVIREILRRKALIVLVTLIGVSLAVLYALATPKVYEATAELLVDPRDLQVIQNEVLPTGLPSEAALALIETQIAVMTSNSVLERVVEAENLTEDPEFNGSAPGKFDPYMPDLPDLPNWRKLLGPAEGEGPLSARELELVTIANLRDSISVARGDNTFVLYVSVVTQDPRKSARLANTIAQIYLDEQASAQAQATQRVSDALSSRLAELRDRVVQAERAVEDYKAENQLIGVDGRLVDAEYLTTINSELANIRAQITGLRVRANSMEAATVDDVVEGTFPEELTSTSLVRLRASYAELDQQADVLRATLGPLHPELIAAEEALASARRAIRGELDRIIAAAQTELSRAVRTEENLTRQIAELKEEQIDTSGAFVRLRELQREAEASRAVYETFLLRSRQTSEQVRLNTSNVRIISEATPPLLPTGMSRKTMVLIGAVLGFGAGLGSAFLLGVASLLRREMREREQASQARPLLLPLTWKPAPPKAGPIPQGGLAESTALSGSIRPQVFATAEEQRRDAEPEPDAATVETTAQEVPVTAMVSSDGDGVVEASAAGENVSGQEADVLLLSERRTDKDALRRRIREIGEEAEAKASHGGQAATDDREVRRLQQEIVKVKEAIAHIRQARSETETA